MKTLSLLIAVETRFMAIVWLNIIWALLAWFCPLLIDFVALVYWNRRGHFLDMSHVRYFFNVADGLFVFLLIISLVMILVTTVVTGFYIYGKSKYTPTRNFKVPVTMTTWFRTGVLVVSIVIMVLVSIGAIFFTTCADYDLIKEQAIAAKYLAHSPEEVAVFRLAAKNGVEMALGTTLADGNLLSGSAAVFLGTGVLMQTANSSVTRLFPNTTLITASAQGTLYRRTSAGASAPITAGDLSYVLNGRLSVYEEQGGRLYVSDPTYAYPTSAYVMSQTNDFNLAQCGLDSVSAMSAPRDHLVRAGNAAPTDQQVLDRGVSRAYRGGLAHAYLSVAQMSISRSYLMSAPVDRMDMGSAIAYSNTCYGMAGFASGLYFFSFVTGLVVSLVLFIMSQVNGDDMSGGVYARLPFRTGEPGEFDDDTPQEEPIYENPTDWTTPTPM